LDQALANSSQELSAKKKGENVRSGWDGTVLLNGLLNPMSEVLQVNEHIKEMQSQKTGKVYFVQGGEKWGGMKRRAHVLWRKTGLWGVSADPLGHRGNSSSKG